MGHLFGPALKHTLTAFYMGYPKTRSHPCVKGTPFGHWTPPVGFHVNLAEYKWLFKLNLLFHLLKPPGKSKITCPVVKSIPFKTKWGKNILKQIEPTGELAGGQKYVPKMGTLVNVVPWWFNFDRPSGGFWKSTSSTPRKSHPPGGNRGGSGAKKTPQAAVESHV